MTPPQLFGNWLATSLIQLLWGFYYQDLGPFRAIRRDSLGFLQMQDRAFGWTVEMQIKAAKQKIKTIEVPVNYRNRIGFSKVSGTITGTLMAGYKIIFTLFSQKCYHLSMMKQYRHISISNQYPKPTHF